MYKHTLLSCTLALAGCVTYSAAPASPEIAAADIAARTPPSPLTFDAAARFAFEHNADLRALAAKARAAGADLAPFELQSEYRTGTEMLAVMVDPIALLDLGPRGGANLALDAKAAAAVTELGVARWRTAAAIAEVFAIDAALRTLDVPAVAGDTAAYERAGLAAPLDTAQANAAITANQAERQALTSDREQNLAALRRLLGVAPGTALDLQRSGPSNPIHADPAAVLARPDLALAKAEFAIADAEFRAAVRAQYPSVMLGPEFPLRGSGLEAMAILRLPIGAWGAATAASHRREAARAALESAVARAQEEADAAESMFVAAQARATAADAAYETSAGMLRAARAAVAVDPDPDAFARYARAAVMALDDTRMRREARLAATTAFVRYATAYGWPVEGAKS